MTEPRTELANPRTAGIDQWSVAKVLATMNDEDYRVPAAVGAVLPAIGQATQAFVDSLSMGGRVFYAGSGSSGRQAVLDAAELVPTFGEIGKRVIALISGGVATMLEANESAEDDQEAGQRDAHAQNMHPADTVIGIAASGRTPYVAGVLSAARARGAKTVAIVGAPGTLSRSVDIAICVDVGPEVVAGSTRLKNASAQKMILNMISTTAMIKLGRTYSHLMAGASSHNSKLNLRARRILETAAGVSAEQAELALGHCFGQLDVALVSLLTGREPEQAAESLHVANSSIRLAVGRTKHQGHPCPSTGMEAAFDVVERAVGLGTGSIPGAVVAVVWRGQLIGPRSFGLAVRSPQTTPMQPDTIFDVASLTKVMATLPAVLLLIERGYARLDDPVALFVSGFAQAGKERVTLRHLLTHTSRLPAHVDLWDKGLSRHEIIEHICAMPLDEPHRLGANVVYSDLGFIMLGEVVTALTGQTVAQFAEREVFGPLGMTDTCFLPPAEKLTRIAATEYREDLGRHMRGEVHDENAYALGGIAGHAGLFSTAEDVARYAAMWLNGGTHQGKAVLSRLTVRTATARHTGGAEPRGLGWILPSDTHSSGGDLLPPRAFGHTGFTGTSLWCIPESDIGIILLTNRVHAGRNGTDIYPLRARFANAVLASASNLPRNGYHAE